MRLIHLKAPESLDPVDQRIETFRKSQERNSISKEMKKIYLDCEFTGLTQDTTLISLAMISEENYEFYAEFTDYDKSQLDDWLRENVIAKLLLSHVPDNYVEETKDHLYVKGPYFLIRDYIYKWLANLGKVEIYSDCLSYDWVLFNQLWGGALNIPDSIYYIPQDLCSYLKFMNIDPDINREEFVGRKVGSKHNSLWDCKVIKQCFEKLFDLRRLDQCSIRA